MVKKKKQKRYLDYDVVKLPEGTVTFGTTLFMRKDHQALRIVFPTGQIVTFCPQDEIAQILKQTNEAYST